MLQPKNLKLLVMCIMQSSCLLPAGVCHILSQRGSLPVACKALLGHMEVHLHRVQQIRDGLSLPAHDQTGVLPSMQALADAVRMSATGSHQFQI